jgi:hypothetical protein
MWIWTCQPSGVIRAASGGNSSAPRLRPRRNPRRIPAIPPEIWRGELGYLAAVSPTVHRLMLELTDRQAAALAAAISDTTAVTPLQ